jgi:hypothetical protein
MVFSMIIGRDCTENDIDQTDPVLHTPLYTSGGGVDVLLTASSLTTK